MYILNVYPKKECTYKLIIIQKLFKQKCKEMNNKEKKEHLIIIFDNYI